MQGCMYACPYCICVHVCMYACMHDVIPCFPFLASTLDLSSSGTDTPKELKCQPDSELFQQVVASKDRPSLHTGLSMQGPKTFPCRHLFFSQRKATTVPFQDSAVAETRQLLHVCALASTSGTKFWEFHVPAKAGKTNRSAARGCCLDQVVRSVDV